MRILAREAMETQNLDWDDIEPYLTQQVAEYERKQLQNRVWDAYSSYGYRTDGLQPLHPVYSQPTGRALRQIVCETLCKSLQ